MKTHVRDGAAVKTIKTLDIPGQKPITIKVNTSDGEFHATVGWKGFHNPVLKDLEEEIHEAIKDIATPDTDQWEPVIVIYLSTQDSIFQYRRQFVLRSDKGKIEWYCEFARNLVDHPGLPDTDNAHKVHNDEFERNTHVIPYTPIAWERMNRTVRATMGMWRAIVGIVNDAAKDGSIVQRTDMILEDAARAAMESLKTPTPTEAPAYAQ